LFADWLGEDVHRAGTHRANGHRNVTMPRDDDDRQRDVALGQLALEVEPAHPAQTACSPAGSSRRRTVVESR
jgi:hypothetical protein